MKKHLFFVLCLIFGLIISLVAIPSYVPFARAVEICVDISGNAPPDITCYESIQSAINDADSGDEIIVYPGTYKECINFLGKAITVRSKDPDDSSIVNQTIIDGSQSSSVVTFNHGEMSNSILNGLTIRNGKAIRGGGIFCESSSPSIIKCTIKDNRDVTNGGGICCYDNSLPIIEDCLLSNNNARDYGGGIFCDINSSSKIISCEITGNSASSGGGIASFTKSSPIIEKCFIENNSCSSYGAGIYCSNASPSIKGSFISINKSSSNGGGIYCVSLSSPYCENTIISANSAKFSAGGIYCLNSTISLTNCTVSANSASTSGGIFSPDGSSISIKNSIIWNNSPDEMSGCNPVASYSDIKTEEGTVFPGAGNINKDPLFLYPEKENYYLQPNSPCIDTGTNEGSPERDIANKTRPQDGNDDGISLCDMGAYEFFVPQIHYVDPNGSIQEKINNAYHFDVIIVPMGIYNENINFLDKAITLTSENPNNLDIVNATVIDGGKAGNVITFNQEQGKYSILKGVSIQNGNGLGIYCYNSASPNILNCNIHNNNSHGIYCYNKSSPNIMNCNIHNNNNLGIYCYSGSSPNILNCSIYKNYSHAIYCNYNCSPKILNCMIDNNRCGIYCHSGCAPSIQDSIITNNSESGIACLNSSSPYIINCNISLNSATNGGGIYCYRSSPNIINSTIRGNTASNAGGGIFCDNNSSPGIENCILTWNLAITGGGIYCYNKSSPEIVHCTINENVANTWGGISCSKDSYPTVKNCILWNNSPLSEQIYTDANSPAVTYSDIQAPEGLYPGTGNINEDPLFINPGKWNLRLQYNSPCIDTGDPNDLLTEDIEGILRPEDGDCDGNSICDMGAYEFWRKICYRDSDEDGFGDTSETEEAFDCECPYGYVENNLDCDDMDPNINPDSVEIPGNDIDENCDGIIAVIFDPNYKPIELYVDSNAPFGGAEYKTIQSAIDAAKTGDVIIVSPGTYEENITISGKVVTLQSIDPNDPNVIAATVIDGGQTGSAVSFKYDDIYYDSNDLTMETKNLLSGFTIRNGKAQYGGGIYCESSSPIIKNCIITDNSSFPYGGGGIYCDNSSASIKDCTIRKNDAPYGGGVCLNNCSSGIEYCTIEENSGFIKGGGIFCITSSASIKNCLITENSAHFGAGIYS
ncbi:MAG: right-handed parallel beta-helix repeat-containing protein, partial [bacterium]